MNMYKIDYRFKDGQREVRDNLFLSHEYEFTGRNFENLYIEAIEDGVKNINELIIWMCDKYNFSFVNVQNTKNMIILDDTDFNSSAVDKILKDREYEDNNQEWRY